VGLIILYVGFAYVLKVAPYLAVVSVILLLITLVMGEEAYVLRDGYPLALFSFNLQSLQSCLYPASCLDKWSPQWC